MVRSKSTNYFVNLYIYKVDKRMLIVNLRTISVKYINEANYYY